MSIMPGATLRLLPENATQPKIVPTQIILHTAVDAPGPTRLDRYFGRVDVGLESHFWITLSGEIVQMMDTQVRADANYRANKRPDGTGAISIETEDEGDPVGIPWSDAQIEAIIQILLWAHEVHGIPLEVCSGPSEPGLGYHAMWGGPSAWTPARGKTCPGETRIRQFNEEILPRLVDQEVIMTHEEARQKARILYAAILGRAGDEGGLAFWADRGEGMTELAFIWSFLASSQKELAKREARLAALETAVAGIEIPAMQLLELPEIPQVDVDAITEAVASRIAERLTGPQ